MHGWDRGWEGVVVIGVTPGCSSVICVVILDFCWICSIGNFAVFAETFGLVGRYGMDFLLMTWTGAVSIISVVNCLLT